MNGDRAVLVIGGLLLLAVLLATANCATHSESKVDASLTRTVDTTTPVAVPERLDFWGYRLFDPLVPDGAGPAGVPTVRPLSLPSGMARAAFGGTLYFGKSQPATTHAATGLQLHAEGEKDAQPQINLLGALLGNWPYALLGVLVIAIIALVGFRKSGLVQRLAKSLPFPFSLLAVAVPETPKE